MKWEYPVVSGLSVQGRDLAADNFATEKRQPLAVLIREASQNPLDARVPNATGPVHIRIRHLKGQALKASYLSSILDQDFLARLNAASKEQFALPPEPSALVIEDFGTVGLEGAYNNPDVDGPGQNWNAFFFREGEGSKPNPASNGRAGQGKVTLYRAGRTSSVFALTTRHSDGVTLLMGRSSFRRNYDSPNGERCERHSFWHCGGNGVAEPTADPAEIAAFEKAFDISRAGKSGLSLVIPYPIDFDPGRAISCLIGDFYLAIARGRLTAEVDGVKLDATTLDTAAATYLTDDIAGQLASPYTSDFRGFITRVLGMGGTPAVTVHPSWSKNKAKLEESDFAPGEAASLKDSLAQGKTVAVRFPVRVREKGCAAVDSHVDVFLEMPEDLGAAKDAYVREDLLIGDEHALAAATHLPPAYGLTLITHRPVSALLADAEEPTHLKWNASRPRLQEDYDGARDVVTMTRQAMPRLLAFLANAGTKRDSKALARFFPASDGSGAKKKGVKSKEKGKGQDEPPPPPLPPPAPRPFRWDHDVTWDRVSASQGTSVPTLPIECVAQFAYEGLDKDAFEAYDPFDFDLGDAKQFKITASGGAIVERKDNKVHFRVESVPFELTVDGFDPHLRRRMRIDYETKSNAADDSDE